MNLDVNEILRRFSRVRVLVVGDSILDHYVIGSVNRISPEAPVPIVEVDQEFDRLGGAANVAANVASFGAQTTLLSLSGCSDGNVRGEPDTDAIRLLTMCEQFNIEAYLLPFLARTIRKTRVMVERQQLLRVDREELRPLSNIGRMERKRTLANLLPEVDIVLVSDYAKSMVDLELFEELRAGNKPIVVDPRPQHKEFYRGVTLITPNRKEAIEMLGLDAREQIPEERLGYELSKQLACHVLVTLGAEGMYLRTRDGYEERIATRAREVFDVTGAGDTVAGVMALALGCGLPPMDAARLANVAAGIVVGHVGTATVAPEEFANAMALEWKGEI